MEQQQGLEPLRSTAVARPADQQQRRSVREVIESDDFRRALASALPRHMTADRFARIAFTATKKNPDLMKCSGDSLFQALMELAGFGLEPDGRRAHLVPREGKVEYMLDYKGIVDLVRRSGAVRTIQAEVVRDGDEFDVRYGTDSHLIHRPSFPPKGAPLCVYAYIGYVAGGEDFTVLTLDEVETARKESRRRDGGPWTKWYWEMAKKTAFRRLSKWASLTPEVREAIEADESQEFGEDATPVREMAAATQAKSAELAQRLMDDAQKPRQRAPRALRNPADGAANTDVPEAAPAASAPAASAPAASAPAASAPAASAPAASAPASQKGSEPEDFFG